jgi:hypothetical protein
VGRREGEDAGFGEVQVLMESFDERIEIHNLVSQ